MKNEDQDRKEKCEKYCKAEPRCTLQFSPSCAVQAFLGDEDAVGRICRQSLCALICPSSCSSPEMKFSLFVTLNNTCVLPQHFKCVNGRAKHFCSELPFGDASFWLTFGLFGGSGDSKCQEPSSQIREKNCLNKVKTRNTGKQTTLTLLHLGNGETFTLKEQTI